MKLKVNDNYRKNAKIGTNFEPSKNEDVVNKARTGTKLSELNRHISYIEEHEKEDKLHSEKNQSEDEVSIQWAMKTTIQIQHDQGLIDDYDNADEVLKRYLLVKVKETRRLSSDQGG